MIADLLERAQEDAELDARCLLAARGLDPVHAPLLAVAGAIREVQHRALIKTVVERF